MKIYCESLAVYPKISYDLPVSLEAVYNKI